MSARLAACIRLSQYNCSKITDVSALGQVHNLNLNRCGHIRGMSVLGSVHTLDLADVEASPM